MFQPMENNLRPVMDHRELNVLVECHTSNEMVAICDEKYQGVEAVAWGEEGLRLGDLKSAYLQIQVSEDL